MGQRKQACDLAWQQTPNRSDIFPGKLTKGRIRVRRKALAFCIILLIATSLVGCGTKDAKEVIGDLSKRTQKMESYSSHGTMTIQTGKEPLKYDVEVWYKKPNYYRVALKNVKKDIVQILLRNDDGVFVLTPQLKKSFRFQSDWPKTSGQVYLYQTLMASILDDQQRQFHASSKEYEFEVAAKYTHNNFLTTQRIWLDRDLYPKRVDVMNENREVLVHMQFDRFTANADFDKDAFDMKRNLESLPADTQQTIMMINADSQTVNAVTPGYIPAGSTLSEERTVNSPQGLVDIMRFAGKNPFTLTQRNPQANETNFLVKGEPIQLDETVATLLEGKDYNRLYWSYDDTDFVLVGKLSRDAMTRIANSTFDQTGK